MSQKHTVIHKDELKPGQMGCYEVNQQRIIIANVEQHYYAFDEMCSHEDSPLWRGALKGTCVECPLHGSRFDLKTGNPLEDPATLPIKVYTTEIIDDMVQVEIG